MSQTVDTNILLYAADELSPRYERAGQLLTHLARGPSLVSVFWPVVMGFLRVATHPRAFREPFTYRKAMTAVEELLDQPHIQMVGEGESFWASYRYVADEVEARGKLVPDAHLVALMHQHGVSTIWTHDRDFRKFSGITVKDPFSDRYAAGFG